MDIQFEALLTKMRILAKEKPNRPLTNIDLLNLLEQVKTEEDNFYDKLAEKHKNQVNQLEQELFQS